MAKMVRRTCAFCSEGEAGSVMYIAKERDIAAHQDCLLFSSGFVESEEYNPENLDIRFDVASVLKELRRGKRLVCNFCRKKGATVGCEERACRRSYHYFCALCDDAAIETDQVKGVYRVFCPKHDPSNRTSHYGAANKKRRYTLTSPAITEEMKTEEKAEENHLQILKRKNNRHKVQIDLVRKCKQAGLLDDIFEEMLDTLHLAQEKLMDDNTSETEYEETVMALFDCGLFENILTNIHSDQPCCSEVTNTSVLLTEQSRKMEATERSRNAVRQSFANKEQKKKYRNFWKTEKDWITRLSYCRT
ncbi:PHD finger protein 11 isoform X1 [Myiozetetes cayanensis]|uniref:PHD finger protein 11 isoform X1 n=1 Tax=Myiozetetes cayanensis TaxID=478635 RepID=UPI0021602576|nr:PHD finger protein 11 isoform X1 [Myiozetetes cayanensis]XP_050190085.1 PHD finger protein 11 isoform X1 [Myiozetetes cayanensis]XP_050190086.1 PHD finger protein 11 isoform X1 [Myiozetetes cayanensis]XP_050190087.1 PHD finger protein 11 isoform X1 [Myiozetetes cayanensis]XP_050190088.1 PHD finger protein 11 isoform X1 [Myiozetetes cayanensis]